MAIMAATAFQTQYRDEFIAGFEQRQSLLRDSVTTEATIKGNTATFLVADSGSATAVTRGVNGLIPARADNLTQTSATLAEWHDLVRKTDFNVFASQGNQRAIMQQTSMAVVNRKIDSDLLTLFATGTITTGAAVTASLGLVMKAKTKLGNAGVPWDSNLFAVISPAFEAYLAQTKEFASREYVNRAPTEGADLAWRDKALMYYWMGVNWIVHPNVSGVGTASESCFMYHKSAVGHAIDVAGIQSMVGYDEEQAYSWARTTANFGSALLQNTGVVEMIHDGSAYA
jgi:hypothetical protein